MSNLRPFSPDESYLSSGDITVLRDWLEAHGDKSVVLGGEYTVAALIEDLDEIINGIWNDGIDAMGEDA